MVLTKQIEESLFYKQDFNLAEDLVKQGADINGSDQHGICFLARAIYNKNLPALKFLLDHGANVSEFTIMAAVAFTHYPEGLSLLISAVNDQAELQRYFYHATFSIKYKEELELFLRNGVTLNGDFITDLNKSLYKDAAEVIYKVKPKITSLEVIEALFINDAQERLELINLNFPTIISPSSPAAITHQATNEHILPLKLKVDGTALTSHKAGVVNAIASVVNYGEGLDPEEIVLTIGSLSSNQLYYPILAYYSLSALQNKHPIYFHNIFSISAQDIEKHVLGLAHYDGKIEIKAFPISHDIAESITKKLFNLLDGAKELTDVLFEHAFNIYISEEGLDSELRTQEGFNSFLKAGLFGSVEGVLFHEITHQVMREIFRHQKNAQIQEGEYTYMSFYPYFNNDAESQRQYKAAVCSTLINIKEVYSVETKGSCQDLWNLGRELRTELLAPDNSVDEEDGNLNIPQLIHGLKFFGKSILGYSTLLSAFSTKSYSNESLDAEFIARFPELEFIYNAKEAISLSLAGREHYCEHILPEIIKAIENHPLRDQISFDLNQDSYCPRCHEDL